MVTPPNRRANSFLITELVPNLVPFTIDLLCQFERRISVSYRPSFQTICRIPENPFELRRTRKRGMHCRAGRFGLLGGDHIGRRYHGVDCAFKLVACIGIDPSAIRIVRCCPGVDVPAYLPIDPETRQ